MTSLTAIFDETYTCERLSVAESSSQRVHTCTFPLFNKIWRAKTICANHLFGDVIYTATDTDTAEGNDVQSNIAVAAASHQFGYGPIGL